MGIEVKYTEKSYPYDTAELLRLQTKTTASPYYCTWSVAGVYIDDSYETLGTKKHKQLFRNQLLGLSMINKTPDETSIDEFISLHLYPSGNEYQGKAAASYSASLLPNKQCTFKALTFETFIQEGENTFQGTEEVGWLRYLDERYIVK